MKKIITLLVIAIALCSCNRQSFVVVSEEEFDYWQGEIVELNEILQDLEQPQCSFISGDCYVYGSVREMEDYYSAITDVSNRIKFLEKRMTKNFIHSDELNSRKIPSRFE